MCKSEDDPMTYLVTPSMTTTCLLAQIWEDSIAIHDSKGAMIKSTPTVFKGCAAGNNRIPSVEGRALAPPDEHVREEDEEAGG